MHKSKSKPFNPELSRKFEVEFASIFNKKEKNIIVGKEMVHLNTNHKHDFDIMQGGKVVNRVELKTDSHIGSDNLFIEEYSNYETKREGGPWQAWNKYGADFFAYWLPLDICDNLYVFKTQELLAVMEKIRYRCNSCLKENNHDGRIYNTKGFIVPKTELCGFINLCKPVVTTYDSNLKSLLLI